MKYICQICGYIYDEEKEGKQFSDLPENWKCPLCGASKSDFKAEGKENGRSKSSAVIRQSTDLERLSAGQMAALCSNLARGCEKQYDSEKAALFTELADYFSKEMPVSGDAKVLDISEMLLDDVYGYGEIRKTADDEKDRGAARICVWGEKVTRMLSSLVQRYINEGENFLKEDEDIWVCTTCGFVYIGKEPPEKCPVCKVPSWKFEKAEVD